MLKFVQIIIIISFIHLPLIDFAQPVNSYHFKKYTVEDGLTNNTVASLLQDSKGFIWAGTRDGINRFDGYHFKIFKFNAGDTNSLGGNFVHILHEDIYGNVWVGTDKGLYRYDPDKENFHLLSREFNYVRDIKSGKDGTIWFIAGKTFYTGMTLYQYNQQKKSYSKYPRADGSTVTAICMAPDGNVWTAGSNGFIEKHNPQYKLLLQFDLFKNEVNTEETSIEKIYPISNDSILIGTSHQGLKLFTSNPLKKKNIPVLTSDHNNAFIRDILKVSGDEYWVGTEAGIFIFNSKLDQAFKVKKDNFDTYSLGDNSVYALIKDFEGGIWIGTYFGGLNYYANHYNKFSIYYPLNSEHSISGNIIRDIASDESGNMWIGTEDAGLNKFFPKTKQFKNYFQNQHKTSISYSNIQSLLADKNDLWIGTFEHGLDRFDINTEKVIRHYTAGSDAHSFKSNFIQIVRKTIQGKILIGTYFGLYQYNPVKDNFDLITDVPADVFVSSIYQDTEGTIWVSTTGDGVFYFNPVTHLNGKLDIESIKQSNRIRNNVIDIFEDSHRNLWFSTEGSGITSYSLITKKIENFSINDGLPSNLVFKILEDKTQQLWISTAKGLVRFNPISKKSTVYTKANGLLSNQFNYSSAFKNSDGSMYFGCLSGLISFNPENFVSNNFVPTLFITGLQINNEEVKTGAQDSILHRSILYTDEIKLNHTQSSLSIDFAALNYNSPKMTKYTYILEGQDKTWTTLETNRRIYFTNLTPGKYTFKAKAFNSSDLPSNEITLSIIIDPPWWLTKLAYSLYILLSLILISYIFITYHNKVVYRNKIEFAKREYEKEEQIHQMKIDFFTNVAHEIKTPLTLIIGPLEKVMQATKNLPELKNSLRFMEKNALRLLELTDQLLDFRTVEINGFQLSFVKTNIVGITKEIFESFESLAKKQNVQYELIIPKEELFAEIDVDGYTKILTNLLSNAIKYATNKTQVFLFNAEGNQFSVKVVSDGHKIPEKFKEKIFEPFFRLSVNEHQTGTGIGLSIAQTLAKLHNGQLFLKSDDENNNSFILELPYQQEINSKF